MKIIDTRKLKFKLEKDVEDVDGYFWKIIGNQKNGL